MTYSFNNFEDLPKIESLLDIFHLFNVLYSVVQNKYYSTLFDWFVRQIFFCDLQLFFSAFNMKKTNQDELFNSWASS